MTVKTAAEEWRTSKARVEDARATLIATIREAVEHGRSEYEVAAEAGVSRMTVRSWLGKGQ